MLMKKTIVLLAGALFLGAGFVAQAQFAKPGGATPDSALLKIFGTNLNFSANMSVEIKMPEQDNDMTMSGKIYFARGDSRTELDMTKMTGTKMPPHTVEQMKAMGMDQMISISHPETKTVYMIYPGLESYTKITLPPSADGTNDAKMETTELGKETVNGHACVKNKYTVSDNGEQVTLLAWLASDLKNYPVKIEISSNRTVAGKTFPTDTILNFTDINPATPAASLFEPPAGYRVYTDIQAMVQTEMMKKMAGANGLPPGHPVPPAGNH
jgi:hypothetical protein